MLFVSERKSLGILVKPSCTINWRGTPLNSICMLYNTSAFLIQVIIFLLCCIFLIIWVRSISLNARVLAKILSDGVKAILWSKELNQYLINTWITYCFCQNNGYICLPFTLKEEYGVECLNKQCFFVHYVRKYICVPLER